MTTTFKPGDKAVVSDRDQGEWRRDHSPLRVGSIVTIDRGVVDREGYITVVDEGGVWRYISPATLDPIGPPLGLAPASAAASAEMVTSLLYALATATGQTPKTVALAHGIGADFLMERDR